MKLITINPNNRQYYSEDFIKGFECGTQRQLEADKADIPTWTLCSESHINSRCPEDVDLIDIIEHIVDCCCAGKTRSGYISPIVIDPEILQKAVENTVKLIDNNTRIVE